MPRLSYGKRHAIRQALAMQKLCFTAAQLLDGDLHEEPDKKLRAQVATALGVLCRNWTALQDSVRILKGEPTPGSLRHEEIPRKPSRRIISRVALLDRAPGPRVDEEDMKARLAIINETKRKATEAR